ncbi:MAG TPA: GNAT family N-acetyltransferase [Tepidisphaeraceae bacterium]|jgi:L-amino acid N-acyltransferase YncA
MQIREATTADTEVVAPLILKVLARHEKWDPARYGLAPEVEKEYRRWFGRLAEDPRTTILIAEDEGRVVGYLVATVHHDRPIYRTGDYVVIHDLWVDDGNPDAGRELLKAVAEHYSNIGVTQLRAATAAANERVRALLQSAGFRVCQIDLLMELPKPKSRKATRRVEGTTPDSI